MAIDIEKVHVEFHLAARAAFFQLSSRFRKDVKPIDRQLEENVFQQLQARYAHTLKIRLEDLALGMLDKYQHMCDSNVLRTNLTTYIKGYLNEFLQKTKFI